MRSIIFLPMYHKALSEIEPRVGTYDNTSRLPAVDNHLRDLHHEQKNYENGICFIWAYPKSEKYIFRTFLDLVIKSSYTIDLYINRKHL